MRYKISKNTIVRSENAALTASRPSKWVLEQILSQKEGSICLDYGCGKLRYTIPMSTNGLQVVAIDSEVQLDRKQKILGHYTTVREYAKRHLKNASVFAVSDNEWRSHKYDFILCANVLSAIPNNDVRIKILQEIGLHLKTSGTALVLNQYRNSYFKQYETRDNCSPYNDGWLICHGGINSFYGIIPPKSLCSLCKKAKLSVSKSGCAGQTGYCIIKNANKPVQATARAGRV